MKRWRQTFYESAAALHGTVPLAINTSAKIIVSFQSVALVTEVLDNRPVGEALAARRAAAVTPVLRFGGWGTHCREEERRGDFCCCLAEKNQFTISACGEISMLRA